MGGYWPLDENLGTTTSDLSGNWNAGTLTNGPTRQTGTNCKYGSCLSFASASSQYVSVPSSSSLSPEAGASGQMSISAWIGLKF